MEKTAAEKENAHKNVHESEATESGVVEELTNGLASMLSNLKKGNVKRPSLRRNEQEKGQDDLIGDPDQVTNGIEQSGKCEQEKPKLGFRMPMDLSGVKLRSTGNKSNKL